MKKKYKILFTVSEFMYSSQVRNLCDLINGIDKDVFDVEIGTLTIGNEATQEIEKLNVPYYLLRTIPPRNINIERFKDFLLSPFIIRRKKYNLIHSLLYQSLFIEPAIIKCFSKAKYIFTKSNIQWDNHPFNWRLKCRLADKIISISRATDDLFKEKGFERKSKKIYLGINTDFFRESEVKRKKFRESWITSEQTFVFGCAAQFIEMKDHITLIEAFEQVYNQYNEVMLCLCGPHHNNDYYRRVMFRIGDSPARDKIHVLGTLDDMPGFYSAIDCFVLPSRVEPFGYVYIEAMSCNRPVIACRAGGPLDIIEENESGFLTEIGSAVDLAENMKRYIENKALKEEHGKNGRKIAENKFSTNIMVKNHQKLYLELLD